MGFKIPTTAKLITLHHFLEYIKRQMGTPHVEYLPILALILMFHLIKYSFRIVDNYSNRQWFR